MKLLSIIYGFIVFLRNKLYDLKIFKEKKVDGVEIICIGNIVAGGTGKTPAVQYFVQKYLEKNPTGYCHVDLSLAKKSL